MSTAICFNLEHSNILFSVNGLTTLRNKALENTAIKGENAGDQHFRFFPQFFLLYQREKFWF